MAVRKRQKGEIFYTWTRTYAVQGIIRRTLMRHTWLKSKLIDEFADFLNFDQLRLISKLKKG
jgi:hypothetical protein